jgi:hypothetical protein
MNGFVMVVSMLSTEANNPRVTKELVMIRNTWSIGHGPDWIVPLQFQIGWNVSTPDDRANIGQLPAPSTAAGFDPSSVVNPQPVPAPTSTASFVAPAAISASLAFSSTTAAGAVQPAMLGSTRPLSSAQTQVSQTQIASTQSAQPLPGQVLTNQTASGQPATTLHYAPNSSVVNGTYAPATDGFNLADVSSVDELNALPAGVKGLVWLGDLNNGVDATFINAVSPFKGNPSLFGFYLADEPDPTGQYGTLFTVANLKAESDWIHASIPSAKTFIVMMNLGPSTSPDYMNTYNPANTGIDLYGLDPYPVGPDNANGFDPSIIPAAVTAAEAAGIPLSQIVPVYQAFGGGGYSSWTMPTAAQETQILDAWGAVVPTPLFDMAYSWGIQSNDTALVNSPQVAAVFDAHNSDVHCFAQETRIATRRGEVAVEDLMIGDEAVLANGGGAQVIWVGHRRVDLAYHDAPDDVRPVRIRANAIDNGMPRRDLLVSPDHALFIDGALFIARLLVNGASIVIDTSFRQVTYFHVELDRHAVILAEGLPAESYLDTGNRAPVENGRAILLPDPSMANAIAQARRVKESCAPLICDPAGVEPMWRLLAVRAEGLGFRVFTPETTDDPMLRVLVGERQFAPINRVGGRYTFVIPRLQGDARLVSRKFVPSEVRPWVDDSRQLGVMVKRIAIRSPVQHVEIAIDDPRLTDGWWASERNDAEICRWTSGDAVIPVEGDRVVVEIWIGANVDYPIVQCLEEKAPSLPNTTQQITETPSRRTLAWQRNHSPSGIRRSVRAAAAGLVALPTKTHAVVFPESAA